MSEKEIERERFLAEMFGSHYKNGFKTEFYLTDIVNREFGIMYWKSSDNNNGNRWIRHLSFSNIKDLMNHINLHLPRHIYHSATRYEDPDAPNMRSKSYINCDLVFDLDIDHIPTSCKKRHDKWACKICGTMGKGIAPRNCPSKKCNSNTFVEDTWECDECMQIAKNQIILLIEEILSKDFGLDLKSDLYIVFSGRRGYHIHIEKEIVCELTSGGRREIVDYVMGKTIHIDIPVTIDIHRLIRLPGSLHGKTGLLVKKLSLSELEKFDPFSYTQVFQGTKKIYVEEAPRFRIGDESFGSYKNEYVELPMNASIFLLARGVATL